LVLIDKGIEESLDKKIKRRRCKQARGCANNCICLRSTSYQKNAYKGVKN
jgi:hypothetical protein